MATRPRTVPRLPHSAGTSAGRGGFALHPALAQRAINLFGDLRVGSGVNRFGANSVWLACAAMAHNLTRGAGHLAAPHYATARAATIRREIINVAARLAHRARTIHLHLPERWPWQNAWANLFTAVHAPPA